MLPLLCPKQDLECACGIFHLCLKKKKKRNDFLNGFCMTWAGSKLGSHVKACFFSTMPRVQLKKNIWRPPVADSEYWINAHRLGCGRDVMITEIHPSWLPLFVVIEYDELCCLMLTIQWTRTLMLFLPRYHFINGNFLEHVAHKL